LTLHLKNWVLMQDAKEAVRCATMVKDVSLGDDNMENQKAAHWNTKIQSV